jgi:hypothetical protein
MRLYHLQKTHINRNRVRHKKCDENKPACTPCRSAGYRCEFSNTPEQDKPALCSRQFPPIATQSFSLQLKMLPSHLPNCVLFPTDFERIQFDYFRRICARDFALLFENPKWELILIQAACTERSIFHAALAVSVLSRTNYSPVQDWHDPEFTGSAVQYAMVQYTRAIKCLNLRLGSGVESSQIAILGSILFINVEGFQGYRRQMHVHLHGGLALLENLKTLSADSEYLETALYMIRDQVEEFEGKIKANN